MRGPRRLVCKLPAIVPRSSTVHLFKRVPCPLHLTGAHSSVRMPRRGGVGRCRARQTDTQTDRHAHRQTRKLQALVYDIRRCREAVLGV